MELLESCVGSMDSSITDDDAQSPVPKQCSSIADDNAVVEKKVQSNTTMLSTKHGITADCNCSSVHPSIADLELHASKAGLSIKILDATIQEEKYQFTMCSATQCKYSFRKMEVIPKGNRFQSQLSLNAVLKFGKSSKGINVFQLWCGEWDEMVYFPRYSDGEPREVAVYCGDEEKTSLEVAYAEIQKWAVRNGFDITKGRSKGNGNGEIRSWRIQCPHSRKNAPRKHPDSAVHRQRKSSGTNCPFHVNIRMASQQKQLILNLQSTDTIITSLFLGHNHAVHPDNSSMLKSNRFFTKEMREEVVRLRKLNCSTDTILQTLRDQYPGKTITVKAIHNAKLGMASGSTGTEKENAVERPKIDNPQLIKTEDSPRAERCKSSVDVNEKRKRKECTESPENTPEKQKKKYRN
ncbi:hypothetical protein BKA69DRAFT_1058371 [Paraphysoderma sedebokerense]|nr:hypothetical protein BKA69DRAFT_1058371 [Paraphysoderma sedebokerense]